MLSSLAVSKKIFSFPHIRRLATIQSKAFYAASANTPLQSSDSPFIYIIENNAKRLVRRSDIPELSKLTQVSMTEHPDGSNIAVYKQVAPKPVDTGSLKKSVVPKDKEFRVSSSIQSADLLVKVKHMRDLLLKGHRVKVTEVGKKRRGVGESVDAKLKLIKQYLCDPISPHREFHVHARISRDIHLQRNGTDSGLILDPPTTEHMKKLIHKGSSDSLDSLANSLILK